jgi:hypothetical protein
MEKKMSKERKYLLRRENMPIPAMKKMGMKMKKKRRGRMLGS